MSLPSTLRMTSPTASSSLAAEPCTPLTTMSCNQTHTSAPPRFGVGVDIGVGGVGVVDDDASVECCAGCASHEA